MLFVCLFGGGQVFSDVALKLVDALAADFKELARGAMVIVTISNMNKI